MEPRCRLHGILLTIVIAGLGCFTGGRSATATEHLDAPLKDRFGEPITPGSTEPYSPRKTCGTCHTVDHIANGYHFQQGRTNAAGEIIVDDDFFGDGREVISLPACTGSGDRPPPTPASWLRKRMSALRGDGNADGTANIADASYVLNFLFSGGPALPCHAAGDANGDGSVNIADVSSLLNFLFADGPPPVDPYPECGPGQLESDQELGCATPPPDCSPGE